MSRTPTVARPLFGLIVDRTGEYAPAWWTMAASAAVSLDLLTFVREGREPG